MAESNEMSGEEVMRILAGLVPIRTEGNPAAGDVRLPSGGWASPLDATAWHEAAHAVVFRALGWRVDVVTIDSDHGLGPGPGHCRVTPLKEQGEREYLAIAAISAMAGPLITSMVREGLGIPCCNQAEELSDSDLALIEAAKAALPEGGDGFEELCQQRAITIILTRREVFRAIVAALLVEPTLDAEALSVRLAGLPL